jgi:hypothetical protein
MTKLQLISDFFIMVFARSMRLPLSRDCPRLGGTGKPVPYIPEITPS